MRWIAAVVLVVATRAIAAPAIVALDGNNAPIAVPDPYTITFPAVPSAHEELETTAMGPLDVHLAVAAASASFQVVWFDLDPEVAGSAAKAVAATCDAFKTYPLFTVASNPVWMPALEGLHAVDERTVSGFQSHSSKSGCDVSFVADRAHVRARVVGSGFRMFQLVVIGDGADPASADVTAFFASFHPAPPAKAAPRATEPVRRHGAFTAIAAGVGHTCALDGDGTPWCWGAGRNGENGRDIDSAVPRPLAAHAKVLAAGGLQTCALAGDKLSCWGRFSQDWDHRRWEVSGLPSAIRSIALQNFFDCVSLDDGGVWCWGSNALGEFGAPTPKDSLAPVRVPLDAPADEVAAGTYHACARMRDGSISCWGRNDHEQVVPPTRIALDGRADQIAAAGYGTCARLHDGTVWCWGEIGVSYKRSPPTKIELPAAATHVALGGQYGCALLADGSLWCWGGGRDGQLGYDDHCSKYPQPEICDQAPPRQVKLPAPVIAVATGQFHACAVMRGGQALCWGENLSGELGRGTQTSSYKPATTR